MTDLINEHAALTTSAGLVELEPRTLIELTGGDRAAFLHNFCTNDIRRLTPGSGCEIFITNVQGKTIGHGYVFCEAESLLLDTAPGQAETLIAALDRYLIREDAQLHDRGALWRELLLAGPRAADVLRDLGLEKIPSAALDHEAAEVQAIALRLRRIDWLGPETFELQIPTEAVQQVRDAMLAAGASACGAAAFDAVRIETGTPLFGRDISPANLPQEVDRDQQAISFTKGCYLGQETVARIDALGHVNKLLRGVRFSGSAIPEIGSELTRDGKAIGTVTSATYSPRLQAPLALAYLRREASQPGTALEGATGPAEVVALPLGA